MRLALDTNAYVDLCKGVEATVRLVATADSVHLPFAVVAELRAGFALGRRSAENERTLRRFLLKPGVGSSTRRPDLTPLRLRLPPAPAPGTPIPTNDLWIAALVLQHNLVLHSATGTSTTCPRSCEPDEPAAPGVDFPSRSFPSSPRRSPMPLARGAPPCATRPGACLRTPPGSEGV